MTSMAGAIAISTALFHRERTGEGQYIDLSMVETAAFADCTAMPYVAANNGGPSVLYRNGQLNSYTCPMGPLKAKNGYIALQAPGWSAESPWGRLCQTMGRDDLIDDPRFATDRDRLQHVEELIEILEGWLQSLPDDEVALALLADARISSGPVLSQEEMLEHPFFESRGTFSTIDYPELGPIQVVEPPFKFSRNPAHVRGPAPQLGEHNVEVLSSRLGLSADEIVELTEAGVLFESPAARARHETNQTQG
jgi:crotonobetainyl-CoA:carnitine CoA-transferase CaiB-like acyl-CoA transferase